MCCTALPTPNDDASRKATATTIASHPFSCFSSFAPCSRPLLSFRPALSSVRASIPSVLPLSSVPPFRPLSPFRPLASPEQDPSYIALTIPPIARRPVIPIMLGSQLASQDRVALLLLLLLDVGIGSRINPGINPRINPGITSKIHPGVEARVTPQINSRINSRVDARIDSWVTPQVNPRVDPWISCVNSRIDSRIPRVNPRINPRIHPRIPSTHLRRQRRLAHVHLPTNMCLTHLRVSERRLADLRFAHLRLALADGGLVHFLRSAVWRTRRTSGIKAA